MSQEQNIREAIHDLLQQRGTGKSICPSEVARRLWPEDWRIHMEQVRAQARQMASEKEIIITQGQTILDPEANFKGPIRLRWPGSFQVKSQN